MARVVLNTFGSLGDLHPYLAIAIELQRRGHHCLIATAEIYRRKVTDENVEFAPVRPDVGELLTQPELIQRLWHPTRGTVYLLRDYLLPKVAQSFEDLNAVCGGADLLLTHAAGYAGPVVAAVQKMRWLSVALQPAIFFSRHDPSVAAAAPWTRHLYRLGRWVFGSMLALADRETRRWAKPVFDLRRQLCLDDQSNPVMACSSALGTLTLFSEVFAPHQPDWPPLSSPTGFVFYDKRGEGFGLPVEPLGGMSEELQRFLAAGPPPLLFTLGSSAVSHPGTFYTESEAAAKRLGMRAVLLTGKQSAEFASSSSVHVEQYAAYSSIMPLSAAVIHQGGIGTVAQTLRAGKPMLVVPWSHDQPDNGYRLEKLGVAKVLPRHRYTAERAADACRHLLSSREPFNQRAHRVAAAIQREDGLRAACNRIEDVLRR